MSDFETGLRSIRYRYLKQNPKRGTVLQKVEDAVRKRSESGEFEGLGWEAIEDAFRDEFAGKSAKAPTYRRKSGHK
jgi:hypothetical protein